MRLFLQGCCILALLTLLYLPAAQAQLPELTPTASVAATALMTPSADIPSINPTPALTATATLVTPSATTEPATASPTTMATTLPSHTPTIRPEPSVPAADLQQANQLSLEITKTLEGSNVVQVGQYLTFTVQIRNTGLITITKLPLIDEYDASTLQAIRFTPAPSTNSVGRLEWSDLTDLAGFGDLAPGASFKVITVFRTIRISDNVINQARVEAAVGAGGQAGVPVEDQQNSQVQGGRVIIEKSLAPQPIRLDNPALTWIIQVRNAGYADLLTVPVEDRFDPGYLRFISASPAPDRIDQVAGTLGWKNMLASLGIQRLQPGQIVTATTTFAVLAPIDNLVVNRIVGTDVRDEFGNAVEAPRQADVRIRVIDVPDTRPTASPIPTDSPGRERNTSLPRATTIPTLTVNPTLTQTGVATALTTTPTFATGASETMTATTSMADTGHAATATALLPATLPKTGAPVQASVSLFWLAMLCVVGAVLLLWRAR